MAIRIALCLSLAIGLTCGAIKYYNKNETPITTETPAPTQTIKPITTPKPRSYTKTKSATPTKGMTVYSAPDEWEWMGKDYKTFENVTTKYSYKDGDYSYSIWLDESEHKIVKVSTTIYVNTKSKSKTTTKSSTKSSTKNELPVSDYVNPDDFYEWYKDDFDDYEEAEDYYYSNGGK
jgi:hypothetical protein